MYILIIETEGVMIRDIMRDLQQHENLPRALGTARVHIDTWHMTVAGDWDANLLGWSEDDERFIRFAGRVLGKDPSKRLRMMKMSMSGSRGVLSLSVVAQGGPKLMIRGINHHQISTMTHIQALEGCRTRVGRQRRDPMASGDPTPISTRARQALRVHDIGARRERKALLQAEQPQAAL